jgi:hypothetical protein
VSIPIDAADVLPDTVTITIDRAAVAPATPTVIAGILVTDKIVGAGDAAFPTAIFDVPSGTLTVTGDSSNQRLPLSILTVTNQAGTVLGTIPHATEILTLTGVAAPTSVTITSTAAVGAIDAAGGTATIPVTNIGAAPVPPGGAVPAGGGGGGGGCFIDSLF